MTVSFPKYYDSFRCIASACPDSCCKEWAVDVDAASAARYRALSGPLGDRLRQVLQDTDTGTVMTIENGRCPMWRPDGLCRIQAELGHDALCHTCQKYPRLTHDYGDFLEQDLELSCPEAARLIFTGDDRLCTRQAPGGQADYDTEAMAVLCRSRNEILSYLDDCPHSLPQALALLLLFGYDVQNELDGGEALPFQPEALLASVPSVTGSGDMAAVFRFFLDLEILTPQWKARLEAGPGTLCWDPRLFAFLRYLIRRYWFQAVSDYDLICRVKFAILSCLMLAALGGDLVETAQLFSKEIENDADNVEAILDGAYTAPALTDTQLLTLLRE